MHAAGDMGWVAWTNLVDSQIAAEAAAVALKLGTATAEATYVPLSDARLTDARVPIGHSQAASTITDFSAAVDARVSLVFTPAVTARATASVGGISTTEVPVLTAPTVTGDGVKRFKISAMFQLIVGTVDGDQFDLKLKDSTLGTVLTAQRTTILAGTGWKQADGVAVVVSDVPAAGLHAYQLAAVRAGGTGTGSVFGTTTAPIEIIVERIA